MTKENFIKRVVASCKTEEQLSIADNWINQLNLDNTEKFNADMAMLMKINELQKVSEYES